MGEFLWTISILDQEIDKTTLNVDVPETLTINTVETCFQTIEEF